MHKRGILTLKGKQFVCHDPVIRYWNKTA